jgi:tRNA(Ile)-lysidine synthase
LVGFSGGGDSVGLALLLARTAPVTGIQAGLVHVDHRLRPGSDAESAAAAGIAERIGLPFELKVLPRGCAERHPGVGVEEAARRERFLALAQAAERWGAAAIALAHQLDDQAETVLLHLLRGAGVSGAAGISEWTQVEVPWWGPRDNTARLPVWRPLLGEHRADVRALASACGIDPIADPSNDDPRLDRNWVRAELLPLLESRWPGARRALARYATIAADEDSLLGLEAEAVWARATRGGELAVDVVRELPPALARRIAHRWLAEAGGVEPSLERVEALLRAARRPSRNRKLEVGEDRVVVQRRDGSRWWFQVVTGGDKGGDGR